MKNKINFTIYYFYQFTNNIFNLCMLLIINYLFNYLLKLFNYLLNIYNYII